MRIGIMGTGRIAARFIGEARTVEGVELSAVYNPRRESSESFARTHGIPAFTVNEEELYSLCDAVYIATPHEYHYPYAMSALKAGKHVLCEKPMSLCASEVRDLYRLAGDKGLVLFEAIKTAYCPGFQQILRVVKSGKIGEIVDVEAAFTKLTPTNLREIMDRKHGGSVTELASYVLLPIMKILGTDYKDLRFQSLLAPNGVDFYTKLILEYSKGFATGKVGLGVKTEGQLLISGTKGYLLAESPWWLTKKFEVRYEDASRKEVYETEFLGGGLRYEIKAFLEAVGKCVYHSAEISENDDKAGADIGVREAESLMLSEIMERYLEEYREKRFLKAPNSEIKIWAHRGCSYACPENSLEAFRAAAELARLTGIELDVQLSKDGTLVVFHDENMKRVTGQDRMICDCTMEELKNIPLCPGTKRESRIPSFREVLELLKPYCDKGLKLNVELKTSVIRYEGIEEKTHALIREFGLEKQVIYSSFCEESIRFLREIAPEAECGVLATYLSDCVKMAKRIEVRNDVENPLYTKAKETALHPYFGGFDTELSGEFKGRAVRIWSSGQEPFYPEKKRLKKLDLKEFSLFSATDYFTNAPELYLK